jgi:hypothetical protein
MISAGLNHDVYKVRADLTPHRLDCTVTGSDGERLYVGRTEPYKQVTEIRLYADNELSEESIVIRSRRMLDISEVYDVWDSSTGVRVGAIRRMRRRSMLRDEWAIIGETKSCPPGIKAIDCGKYAVLKRAFCGSHEHRFHAYVGGRRVGTIRDRREPNGSYYIETDFPSDAANSPDKRLSLAAGVLLLVLDTGLR